MRLVAVVLGLVRAFDGHAEIVGLLLGEGGELDADLLKVQAGDFLVQILGQDDRRRSCSCRGSSTGRAARGIWLAKLLLMTKLGCPVAQPRFTRRPSASRKILWPSGKVYLSTCGLMLVCFDAGEGVEPVHLDLVVEVADVTDDGLVLHLGMCSRVMTSHVAGGGDVDVAACRGCPRWW